MSIDHYFDRSLDHADRAVMHSGDARSLSKTGGDVTNEGHARRGNPHGDVFDE